MTIPCVTRLSFRCIETKHRVKQVGLKIAWAFIHMRIVKCVMIGRTGQLVNFLLLIIDAGKRNVCQLYFDIQCSNRCAKEKIADHSEAF
jgi:hypothetical protein